MNKRQVVIMAAAALGVLSMSACSAETAGVPSAATSTTTVLPADETATAAPVPKVSTVSKYEDVSGQGQIHQTHLGGTDHQYGLGAPIPGAEITTFDELDRVAPEGCTLGPAVTDGARSGFITAGHCSVVGDPETYVAIGPGTSDTVLLGTPELVLDTPTDDSAVIWTDTAAAIDMIADTWPIDGVMPLEELARLDPGTWVCINGAVSGVKCEPFIRVEGGTRIISDPLSVEKDSGSPVFVVDIVTKRATLIGITKGDVAGAGTDDVATALAPALARIGAEVITAPR